MEILLNSIIFGFCILSIIVIIATISKSSLSNKDLAQRNDTDEEDIENL